MPFVVSSGQLRAIERPIAPAIIQTVRVGAHYRTYASLWKAQPELRTVVDFLSRNLAQLPIHTYERVSDVDRRRLNDHPLAALLGNPNPSTTPYRMLSALVHDLCIYDNAFWLKVKGEAGRPVMLRRIRPSRVWPSGEDWLEAPSYTIQGNSGRLTVDAAEMIHFRGYDAEDDRIGCSPIESLRHILAEEWAANVYREQLWRNGARMSGYIKRPPDAPEWSPKARRRFRDEWQGQWSGDEAATAGGTPILEDGMDWVAAATSPRDAQYVESRKLTREEVARSYHVPLPMVGILDHATFSNIREQHKQLYADCLAPWLTQIQQEIELQLLPDLEPPGSTSNIYVEFEIAEKLRGSFEEQAAQLYTSVGAPYMTRNEARARLNLPQIDGGDQLVTPLNVTTAADAPPAEDAAGQASTEPVIAETLRHFFTRQERAVLSALDTGKAAGGARALLPQRWDDELAVDLCRADWQAAEGLAATAEAINADSRRELAAALRAEQPAPAVKALYARYRDHRAAQLAAALASHATAPAPGRR